MAEQEKLGLLIREREGLESALRDSINEGDAAEIIKIRRLLIELKTNVYGQSAAALKEEIANAYAKRLECDEDIKVLEIERQKRAVKMNRTMDLVDRRKEKLLRVDSVLYSLDQQKITAIEEMRRLKRELSSLVEGKLEEIANEI